MARILNKQDILEMAYGACLLAGGGGGSLDNAIQILDEMDAKKKIAVEMITVDEIERGRYVGTCGGMGSPLKFKERGANCIDEPVFAFRALERVGHQMNRKVSYIMALEYGALNTVLPYMVAFECGVPVVDADGTGRAVPSIQTLLYGINEVPIAPFVMADMNENITITYPSDPLNAAYLDVVGRHMCMASDMVMGVAFAIVSAEDIKTKLVPDAYVDAQAIGKAMLKAKADKTDVFDELEKAVKCKELFRGKITKFINESRGGWDFGAIHVEGSGKYKGKTYSIDIQNESLVAYEGKKVLMTVPDIITAINLDTGDPSSNADFSEGMNISVIGIPVHDNWFISDRGVNFWQYHFDAVGYKGGIVRY